MRGQLARYSNTINLRNVVPRQCYAGFSTFTKKKKIKKITYQSNKPAHQQPTGNIQDEMNYVIRFELDQKLKNMPRAQHDVSALVQELYKLKRYTETLLEAFSAVRQRLLEELNMMSTIFA